MIDPDGWLLVSEREIPLCSNLVSTASELDDENLGHSNKGQYAWIFYRHYKELFAFQVISMSYKDRQILHSISMVNLMFTWIFF